MVDRFHVAAAAALFFLSGSASAGYAQLSPPPGWSVGSMAVNDSTFIRAGSIITHAEIPVGGKLVKVPASLRFAANAPRYAAGLIFANPALRLAVTVGGWMLASDLGNWVWDEAEKKWLKPDASATVSDGLKYCTRTSTSFDCGAVLGYFRSKSLAVSSLIAYENNRYASIIPSYVPFTFSDGSPFSLISATGSVVYTGYWGQTSSDCPAGWYVTPAGCIQNAPMQPGTKEDFEDILTQTPMPEGVPVEVPGQYPVEMPRIVPMFIPTGEPVPNPAFNPDLPEADPENLPLLAPGVRLAPAPTTDSPWQVDLVPINKPSASAGRDPSEASDPSNPASKNFDPDASPSPPGTISGPKQDTPDLCEKHPEIVACQKLDKGDGPGNLPVVDLTDQIVPVSGWFTVATCPAPVEITYFEVTLQWTPLCNTLELLRPLVLAFAWLGAGLLLVRD